MAIPIETDYNNRRGILISLIKGGLTVGVSGVAAIGWCEVQNAAAPVYNKPLTRREDGNLEIAKGNETSVVGIELVLAGNSPTIALYREPRENAFIETLPPDNIKAQNGIRVAGHGYSSLNPKGEDLGRQNIFDDRGAQVAGLWFRLTNLWGDPVAADGYVSDRMIYVKAINVNVVRTEEEIREDLRLLQNQNPQMQSTPTVGTLQAPGANQTPQPVK